MEIEVNRRSQESENVTEGLIMNFDIDIQNLFMEFVIHVMNNEEERVTGIDLLVLNIRKKPGSYEKKLSH